MKIAQADEVELISIRTKSLQDLDNEINLNLHKNFHRNSLSGLNGPFKPDKHEFSYKSDDESSSENEEEDQKEDDEFDDEHYKSTVRYVTINKSPNGACGFHLTRTKWDPYPWVSAVDEFTPAAKSDIKAGDCILEVNGCDILGLRITEIAKLVKSTEQQVTLLLWSSYCNNKCNKESLCAAPMPRSLQRLSLVVQMILSLIECPVCLDTITPPAMQCQNGHLLCVNCRVRAEKCPVCRDRYFPRPALIAEQIQSAITSAFNLCRNEDKMRQKIFGRHNRQRQMVKTTLKNQQKQHQRVHKSLMTAKQTQVVGAATTAGAKTTVSETTAVDRNSDGRVTDKMVKSARCCSSNGYKITSNKLFTKFSSSKAYSMENLTNGHCNRDAATAAIPRNRTLNTCHTTITSAISQLELLNVQQQQQQKLAEPRALLKDSAPALPAPIPSSPATTSTNQFYDSPSNASRNYHYSLTHKPYLNVNEIDLHINSKLCCKQMLNNKTKRVSLSSDKDLTRTEESITCLLESPAIFMNGKKKINCPPVAVLCETSHATIPRAIHLKEEFHKNKILNQNDLREGKETAGYSLKSHCSSMTSLNLSLTTASNLCCCDCSTASSLSSPSCSSSSSPTPSSSGARNCQSSLSSASASSPSPALSSSASH